MTPSEDEKPEPSKVCFACKSAFPAGEVSLVWVPPLKDFRDFCDHCLDVRLLEAKAARGL